MNPQAREETAQNALMEVLEQRMREDGKMITAKFAAMPREGGMIVTLKAECAEEIGEEIPMSETKAAAPQKKSSLIALIVVMFGLRLAPTLRDHLNKVSSFKVGPIWIVCMAVITPLVLAYALAPLPAIGVTGIWWAVPIGWALADAVGFGYYMWRKRSLIG